MAFFKLWIPIRNYCSIHKFYLHLLQKKEKRKKVNNLVSVVCSRSGLGGIVFSTEWVFVGVADLIKHMFPGTVNALNASLQEITGNELEYGSKRWLQLLLKS